MRGARDERPAPAPAGTTSAAPVSLRATAVQPPGRERGALDRATGETPTVREWQWHRYGVMVTLMPGPPPAHWPAVGVVLTAVAAAVLLGRLGLPAINLHSPPHSAGIMDRSAG